MSKKATPPLQLKTFSFSVKATDDEQGLIEAYGSVFDNTDSYDDVVRPGSFKRTIQNSKSRVQDGKSTFLIPMLFQHDPDRPIGGWKSLEENSHGLLCKGQIVLSTQLGRETYELIKAGVINEFSIGFDIPKGGSFYDKETGLRNLTEIRLWEISPVSFAANREALLVGVKAKENTMDKTTEDTVLAKSIQEYYMQEMCKNLMKEWGCTYLRVLTKAVIDALKSGQPEQDMAQAMDDFKALALDKWLAQALEIELPQYLSDNSYTYSPDYCMYDGYMSNRQELDTKAGRVFSASNEQKLKDCAKSLHGLADDLDALMPSTDDEEEEKARKAVPSSATHGSPSHSSNDTAGEEEASLILLTLQQAQYQLSNI